MSEPTYKFEPIFGRVEIDSWLEWRDGKLVGMGRRREYNEAGELVFASEPQPTGVSLTWGSNS